MSAFLKSRPFVAGSVGWTAADLDDPEIEREWDRGHFELVEGVLALMPAAYFAGCNAVANLMYLLKAHSKANGLGWQLGPEADIVLNDACVPKADAVMLIPADQRRQAAAARRTRKPDPRRVRILVPPSLVIESISPGHELHDERTKREWYAEFGVERYWIVNAFKRSIICLVMRDGRYVQEARGTGSRVIRLPAMSQLEIPLREVWEV